MTAVAPKLFVSYRRRGTTMHAGRLYDAMADRFGEDNVFMDLEMEPGVDFVERITTAVGSCRVLLVVIGPEWLGVREGSGASRLSDPEDFVRLEVELALNAADVTVIPVLVAGAQMPGPAQLPPELRSLARRNAFEMTDLKWRYDCVRLMEALDRMVGEPLPDAASPDRAPGESTTDAFRAAASPAATRALLPLWLEGVAIATAAGMLARLFGDRIDVGLDPTDAELILTTMARRGVSWAVIGLALAVWLCLRRGEYGRLPQRAVAGLLLGGLAGALNGAIWAGLVLVPDAGVSPETVDLVAIAALAATGAVLGATIGGLWTPRHVAVGLFAGVLGAVLVQAGRNAFGNPSDVYALGLNCFVIVGVVLLALLTLDVRAAGARRAEAAPQALRA